MLAGREIVVDEFVDVVETTTGEFVAVAFLVGPSVAVVAAIVTVTVVGVARVVFRILDKEAAFDVRILVDGLVTAVVLDVTMVETISRKACVTVDFEVGTVVESWEVEEAVADVLGFEDREENVIGDEEG